MSTPLRAGPDTPNEGRREPVVARSTLPPVLPEEVLSTRQLEVLRAYAEHGSAKEAADALGVVHSTVRMHLTNAYAALGVTGVVNAYRALGWLVVPE